MRSALLEIDWQNWVLALAHDPWSAHLGREVRRLLVNLGWSVISTRYLPPTPGDDRADPDHPDAAFADGFGGMALSHVYGQTEPTDALATLHAAVDAGATFLDTADVYGEPRPGTQGPAERGGGAAAADRRPGGATRCPCRSGSGIPDPVVHVAAVDLQRSRVIRRPIRVAAPVQSSNASPVALAFDD